MLMFDVFPIAAQVALTDLTPTVIYSHLNESDQQVAIAMFRRFLERTLKQWPLSLLRKVLSWH
jgi:hypothetical protein